MHYRNQGKTNEINLESFNLEKPIIIKFNSRDIGIHCCCANCCRDMWDNIEHHLVQEYGARKLDNRNEPSFVIKNEYDLLIECHESGPEIITTLGMLASSTTIINDILTISKYIYNYLIGSVRPRNNSGNTSLKVEVYNESEDGTYKEKFSVDFNGSEESFNILIKSIKNKLK